MFVRQCLAADRLDGRVRRVGLGAVVLGAAVAAAALATGSPLAEEALRRIGELYL